MNNKIINIFMTVLIWTISISISKSNFTGTDKCVIERRVCSEHNIKIGTRFYVFTSRNKDNPEALHKCNLKLPGNSYFNKSNPVEIIIHGWNEGICINSWMLETKDELLKRQDYNVIVIDWSYHSVGDYYDAIRGMDEAIDSTVTLVDNIKKQTDLDYRKIHVIGHSLGSHFAGIMGQKTKIYRITALDPAGPAYSDLPNDRKLDRNDADFVDAIHTNAGRCLPFLGNIYPHGDEDFYVEGGKIQTSCFNMAIESILKLDLNNGIINLLLPTFYFHKQSIYYFKSSINADENCCFVGKQCDNYKDALRKSRKCTKKCGKNMEGCSIMGMDWPLTYKKKLEQERVYIVDATNTCPYCNKCIPGILKENKDKKIK